MCGDNWGRALSPAARKYSSLRLRNIIIKFARRFSLLVFVLLSERGCLASGMKSEKEIGIIARTKGFKLPRKTFVTAGRTTRIECFMSFYYATTFLRKGEARVGGWRGIRGNLFSLPSCRSLLIVEIDIRLKLEKSSCRWVDRRAGGRSFGDNVSLYIIEFMMKVAYLSLR